MAIQTRSSALAVKVETTEGTPVAPTASADYVAMQDDFAMSPSFDTLDSAELKASIGKSKSVLGLENPTTSFSHYLRHSGVEGQAPNFKQILKAGFGAEDVESVEYNTVASSTTSVIKVDVGEGASFMRGQPLLIKDGTNGYRIRAVESISSDDLTIGFQVPTAPGTGVNLGKAVTYYPANTGHQTLSLWHYLGNGGAVQMMAGARPTSIGISATAGDFVNASFSLDGTAFYFNPIEITATSNKLDFNEGAGELTATVTAKMYKDPVDLASAIETAMNAVGSDVHTVTYSHTTGKFTIDTDGATFSLLWSSGTNTANTIGSKLGFVVSADDTGALTYTSDNAVSWASPQTPSYDASSPLVAKNNEVMFGDASDYVCFNASSIDFTLANTKADILSICAESGKSGSIISERTATVSVTALLSQHDAANFHRFHQSDNVKFQFSFGNKSGGNWIAGQAGCLFMPTATITSYNIEDQDGLVALSMELTAYVNDNAEGEVFLSFV